jgi:hypothetical protein
MSSVAKTDFQSPEFTDSFAYALYYYITTHLAHTTCRSSIYHHGFVATCRPYAGLILALWRAQSLSFGRQRVSRRGCRSSCPLSGPLIGFSYVERRPWRTLRTSTCVAAPLSYVTLAHATQRAIEMVQRAIDEDNKQNYAEAYRQYQNALDYFMLAMKCACAHATRRGASLRRWSRREERPDKGHDSREDRRVPQTSRGAERSSNIG